MIARDTLPEAVATPEDLVLALKDAFGERLDLAYMRAQADLLGPDVRHRLDLVLP